MLKKILKQFQPPEGAAGFAIVHSATDTLLKNGLMVFGALTFIADFETD